MAMEMELTARDGDADAWLRAFHAGDRTAMTSLYYDHFATVAAAVGRVLTGADQETVIHEVFFKLIASPDERLRFQGGSFAAWITTVAHHQAIDHLRRRRRELAMTPDQLGDHLGAAPGSSDAATARVLIERFRAGLPDKWRPVFDRCFLGQLSQRDAAAELGISRTTLAYQYLQIRARLRKFLVPRKQVP